MARKRSPARLLLDTSAVVHQLHGHTLQQAAVREAVAGGEVGVPVFVRMEYLRGVILMTVPQWLGGHEDWQSKPVTLRRLGDLILRMIRDFDETYPRPPDDPLA